MNCPHCNAQLPMGAVFCPVCGTPVQQAPQPAVQQQPGYIPPQTAVPPQGGYQQPAYIPPQGVQQQPGYIPPQGFQQPIPPQAFYQQPVTVPPRPPVEKKFKTYLILWLLLQDFGIHDFYAGYIGRGITHIALAITGLAYFIDIFDGYLSMSAALAIICVATIWINRIWSIVEIVSMLNKRKDANGILMAEFQPENSLAERNQKSFKAFFLWGYLGLGEFGAHDFYACYAGRGFMHIILTLITIVVLGLPNIYICSLFLIHVAWIIFEFVNTFKDANGNMMKEFKKEHGCVLPEEKNTEDKKHLANEQKRL